MTDWYRQALRCTGALIVLALALASPLVAHAQSPGEAVKIRVEVTDAGFVYNGKQGDPVVEVEQGKLVELTFVWAHKGYVHDEHIMVLEGYKLESEKLTSEHREVTLKFVADKPGTFRFKCDLDCEVHDYMQRGILKVRRGGEGAAAALTPTKLDVSPSSWTTGGETVTLMAALKDASGNPVPKAWVRFFLDAEFAGAKGKMDVGSAKTDANGVAFLDFQPTFDVERNIVSARFEGMGVYAESEQAIELRVTGVPPSAYTMSRVGLNFVPRWAAPVVVGLSGQPLPLEALNRWPTLALAGAVLIVWAVFGFILFQAFGIARVRSRR